MPADEFGLLKNVFGVAESINEDGTVNVPMEPPTAWGTSPLHPVKDILDANERILAGMGANLQQGAPPVIANEEAFRQKLEREAPPGGWKIEKRDVPSRVTFQPPPGMHVQVVSRQLVQLGPDLIINVGEIRKAERRANYTWVHVGPAERGETILQLNDQDGTIWRRIESACNPLVIIMPQPGAWAVEHVPMKWHEP
jgi:hypothetical protein